MYLRISRAKVKKHNIKIKNIWAGVVLVRRLTEWRRFHFWFQPGDALNSGSSLNSFAFRRTIDPLTAIPMQNQANSYAWCKTQWEGTIKRLKMWHVLNLFWHFVKTGQWESFIHNVVTWYYNSFESHTFNSYSLCNQLIDSFRYLVSVVLKLCCFSHLHFN